MTVENKKTNGDLEFMVSSTLAQALTNFQFFSTNLSILTYLWKDKIICG